MADAEDLVDNVLEVLHDGHKGFSDLAEHVKDPQLKTLFVKESQVRAEYSLELETVGYFRKDEGGTAVGTMRRFWGEFKEKLGGGDHALLETAEQGEDAANKTYQSTLEESAITGKLRQILEEQQTHIQHVHDLLKAFRNSKAA